MRATVIALFSALSLAGCALPAAEPVLPVSGVNSLFLMTGAQSRSISPENLTGEKGMGGRTPAEQGSAKVAASKLGLGWKVNPYINIAPGASFTMGEAAGPGIINHIWLTLGGAAEYRSAILRIYWDDEATP